MVISIMTAYWKLVRGTIGLQARAHVLSVEGKMPSVARMINSLHSVNSFQLGYNYM